jgi:hypothetical protein
VTLDGPIREAQTARTELAKVASSTQGWADRQRQAFDAQRLKPLADAGAHLVAALQRAQEQCAKAERLLSDR